MDSNEPAATAAYSALVRGPSPSFPRGGVWMFFVWYAGIYVIQLFVTGLGLVPNLLVLVVFGAAAAAIVTIFTKARSPAFTADAGGIWLGKNSRAMRPLRVEWEQVRKLTISSSPHGSILQVLLNPDVTPAGRGPQIASLALMMLPFGFRRTTPELLTVLPDPPRYRVPLAQVTAEELRSALSALIPTTLPIDVHL